MAKRRREKMSEGKKNIIADLIQEYDIKTAADIQEALKDLLGGTIQEMMEAELDEHLGYEAYEEYEKSNRCNIGLDFGTCYSAGFGGSGRVQEPQQICWESSVFFALPQSDNLENIDAFAFEKYAEEIRNLPNDFNGTLKYFCDKSNMPLEEIAHRAGMSDRNLRRIISDKAHQPKLESVIAICIALHLFPLFSNSLILKAGYTLRNNDKGIAYQMLLNMFYMNDIEICNRLLKSMVFSPLTKEEY